MGVWVKSLTGSNAAAGLTFFAFGLPQLFAPLSGLLVDRVRRRPLLVAALFGGAALILPLLLVRGPQQVWLIYLTMLLYGAVSTIIGAAQSALLKTMVPDELLVDANGALRTVRESLRLIAPLVGAGIFAWRGGGFVAVVDALTFLSAATALLAIRVHEPRPARPDQRLLTELTAGLRHVGRTVLIRQVVTAAVIAVLVVRLRLAATGPAGDGGHRREPAVDRRGRDDLDPATNPTHLQGRVSAAIDMMIGIPQTVSIAVGAALITVIDYRLLLALVAAVMALSAGYILTRKAQWRRRASLATAV
jgi:MFS family permease